MKKTLYLAAMLMLCCGGYAQYSNLYYHIVGDTIMQTPNNGYLPFWGFYNTISDGMPIVHGSCHGTYAQEFYTSTPIRILGVAAAIESWTTQPPITRVDTTYLPEYFKIYQGFGKDGQPIEVASVEWRDLSNRRYLHLDGNFDNIVNYSNPCFTGIGGLDTTQCCCVGAKSKTLWLNEFYLDNAITIVDTFYVGIVINNTAYNLNLDPADYLTNTQCEMIETLSPRPHCGGTPCILCTNNFLQYSYFDSAFYRVPGNFVLIMYPIIELDTTVPPQDYCPDTIANLVIQPTSATCLAATWDAFPNYTEVQLTHGPITTAQADWDTVTLSTNVFTVCNIDTAAGQYGIRLRAICANAGDTTEWTNLIWTSTHNMGIASASAVASTTSISPNPATSTAHVSARYNIMQLDVYNARGVLVYTSHPATHTADIDLAGLPAGTYIVSIQTINGSTTKRLVVQ